MKRRQQLRSVVADLTGRGQKRLVEELRAHVQVARAAVDVAREAAGGDLDVDQARTRIGELESEGDRHREALVTALSRTLVIPIDREDLFRLSRSVDDVLDNLRDFARELDLFGAEVRSPLFDPVLEAIAEGLDEFADAVGLLAEDPAAAMQGTLRAKKRGNEVRRRFQQAMAELRDGEVSSVTLKRRELLRRLDVVGLRMGEATDALADGGLKRGS
jgi:uncharacterized protein